MIVTPWKVGTLPFSADNPNKNRNYVVSIIAGVIVFAIVMAVYSALAIAGRDTDEFIRFLTLLVAVLIPGTLSVLRSNTAAHNTEKAIEKVDEVKSVVEEGLNGSLEKQMKNVVRSENIAQTKREQSN